MTEDLDHRTVAPRDWPDHLIYDRDLSRQKPVTAPRRNSADDPAEAEVGREARLAVDRDAYVTREADAKIVYDDAADATGARSLTATAVGIEPNA